MNMRKFKVGMAAVLILGIVVLFFVVNVRAQGPALPPGEYDLEAGQYDLAMHPLSTVILALMTPTPVAPTDTPVSPTDTPVPSGHDETAWHPLTEAIGHEHGSDPNSVNDIFGEPGCWYGNCGQSISYPFETPNENVLKHEVYTWFVRRDLVATSDPWIKAFRAEAHFTGGALGTHGGQASGGYMTRVHSAMIEAQVCRQSDGACGLVRFGMYMNSGCLVINNVSHCLPGEEPFEGDPIRFRSHSFWAGGYPPSGRNHTLWYTKFKTGGKLGLAVLNLDLDDSSVNIDPNDISTLTLLCPEFDCEFNDSLKWIHRMKFKLLAGSFEDPDGDGLVSESGLLGLDGGTCTEMGLWCAPYVVEDAPIGAYAYDPGKNLPAGISKKTEYDISPEGEWWIKHPN